MKKKVLIGLSVLALVALMAVGTWAWFTDESGPVGNTFKAGTVTISLTNGISSVTNWNPGDTETGDIKVTNTGSKAAYVRVELDASWNDDELLDSNVELALNTTDWVESDGYYYYKGATDGALASEATAVLLSGVTLNGAATDNAYQGKTFTINATAEAVQASNDAYQDVWGLTALPW